MNTNELDKIYIGSNEATKLYNGDVLVWDKESPPVEPRTMTKRPVGTTDFTYGYWESLPPGYSSKSNLPLIVFLHGGGERGSGSSASLDLLLQWAIPKMCYNGTWEPGYDFIMLAPQCLSSDDLFDVNEVNQFILDAIGEYKVNADRVYLTGLSMGGFDTFTYLGVHGKDSLIAAALPLSANYDPVDGGTYANLALSNVPIWVISNDGDPDVAFYTPNQWGCVLDTVEEINTRNPGQILVTAYDADDHTSAWDKTYDSSGMGQEMPQFDPFDMTVYEWMMQYTKQVYPEPELVSIDIQPDSVTEIEIEGTQQYTAYGHYDDSSSKALTDEGGWASSDTDILTVSASGLVTGISEGSATLSYTVDEIEGTLNISVSEEPVPPASVQINLNLSRTDNSNANDIPQWNKVAFPSSPISGTFSGFVDTLGNPHPMQLVVIGGSINSLPWFDPGDEPSLFPIKEAYQDTLLWNDQQTAFELRNLDPAKTYDIRILSGDTDYSSGEVVSGFTIGASGVFLVDASEGVPQDADFDNEAYAIFDGVSPNGSGVISLQVSRSGSENYGLMMAIMIRENP